MRARRPGAGYSAIVLGLALAKGAVAAGVYSNGVWSQDAILLGNAFTLGVLALGLVIAGIRGRTDGAMGGFAFLAAATPVVLGVFPQGTQFTAVGDTAWQVSANDAAVNPATSYAMIAGQTTLDLSDFDNPGLDDTIRSPLAPPLRHDPLGHSAAGVRDLHGRVHPASGAAGSHAVAPRRRDRGRAGPRRGRHRGRSASRRLTGHARRPHISEP
ncbi:hypothetical protein E3T46_12190 [Cryobacterium sp. Hh11]|uniref:hypothetical protein n=1 Tax=Cryobacterium sp. Hh11 TaxID=2555868 RepID=UPI00106D78E9|nr:hypothetical protein [Cryobacterium sp. Hh11]TFD50090.1 hypothetical protein E3T46_12190 [Cryobacterium sp. Hh11]